MILTFNFKTEVDLKKPNLEDPKRIITKSFFQYKVNQTQISNIKSQIKGGSKVQNLKSISNRITLIMIFSGLLTSFAIISCSDSNVAGTENKESKISSSGERLGARKPDSTIINLDLTLQYKSESITDSKILESNIGNRFNHIVSIDIQLEPDQELDLQELQPYGIFGLYLSSTGSFTLHNSDGMGFTSKTVLMEKCSFIDLKLKNQEQTSIRVRGFIAGE